LPPPARSDAEVAEEARELGISKEKLLESDRKADAFLLGRVVSNTVVLEVGR
jgi:hypothetical protein